MSAVRAFVVIPTLQYSAFSTNFFLSYYILRCQEITLDLNCIINMLCEQVPPTTAYIDSNEQDKTRQAFISMWQPKSWISKI